MMMMIINNMIYACSLILHSIPLHCAKNLYDHVIRVDIYFIWQWSINKGGFNILNEINKLKFI